MTNKEPIFMAPRKCGKSPMGGEMLSEILAGLPEGAEVLVAPLLGVDFVEPWTVALEDE
ncbi:hypothetical protein [Mycobacterium phage WXIN]|nr:hypothetical protein [Mycobacterium phage WXIN]